MTTQPFKISRTYPIFQHENWIDQTTELIQTIPQFDNVKYWGATGNGVTDDYAAFAAALLARSTVFVPFGVYILSQPITIRFGASLVGLSHSTFIRLTFTSTAENNAASVSLITMNEKSVLENLAIVYLGTNLTTSRVVRLTGNSAIVEKIEIFSSTSNYAAYGVYLNTVSACTVFQSIIYGTIAAIFTDANAPFANTFLSNTLVVGNTGTCVLSSAGSTNLYIGNVLRQYVGSGNGFNLGISNYLVSNNFVGLLGTLRAGAGILRYSGALSNVADVRATNFDMDTITLPQLADLVGDLINDLKNSNLIPS